MTLPTRADQHEPAPADDQPRLGLMRFGARRALSDAGRRRLIRCGFVLLGWMGAAAVVCGAWVGVNTLQARSIFQDCETRLFELHDAAAAQDTARTAALVAQLQHNAARAKQVTSGTRWAFAGAVPVVRDNTRSVAAVAGALDRVAQEALPGLLDAYTFASPARLAPVEGRVDFAPLSAALPEVMAVDAVVKEAHDQVRALPSRRLASPLRHAVVALGDRLEAVRATTATASRSVQLLPPMLGVDGPRDYLVLVQNNSEPRALGGTPATVLRLRADQGAVRLAAVRSAAGMRWEQSVVPVTGDERALFTDEIGRYMADVTNTADFPRAAEIAVAMWREATGDTDIDGVVALDPVTLAHVLGAMEPIAVTLPDGTALELDSRNVAPFLLHDVYLRVSDSAQQDAVFSAIAQEIISRALADETHPAQIVQALVTSAEEGRLLVWSAHENEQRLIGPAGMSGVLVSPEATAPVVGVYLAATGAERTSYYLDKAVAVANVRCEPDGSRTFDVTITLTSTLDPDLAGDLPESITSETDRSGAIHAKVLLYAPQGGGIVSFSERGGAPRFHAAEHHGLAVGVRTAEVAPGKSKTLAATLSTPAGSQGEIRVRMTPGARPDTISIDPEQCT